MTRRHGVRAADQVTPTEHQEQASLFAWAAAMAPQVPELEMLAAVLNTAGLVGGFGNNRAMVAKLYRIGMRKGYPDVTLDVAAGGAHGLRIELKRLRGSKEAEPDQLAHQARLRSYGYRVEQCRGWIAAANVIAVYLRPILSPRQYVILAASIPRG